MAYDNTNRGTIAKNTRKTEDKHPDIAGQINVEGVDYWINGWAKKNSQDGSSFYSLTVKRKEPKPHDDPRAPGRSYAEQSGGSAAALDDDLPFAPEFR